MSEELFGEIQELKLDGPGEPATPPVAEEPKDDTTPAVEDKPTEDPIVPPLHEHPRFKEVVEEKNTYKKQYEDLLAKQAEAQAPISTPSVQPEVTNVPQEFIDLYGTNAPEHWEAYKRLAQQTSSDYVKKSDLEQAVSDRIAQMEQDKVTQAELTKQYAQQYETQVKELAVKYNIDAGKFRKWFTDMANSGNPIVKINPENPSDYEYDFAKGAEIFAQINPPTDRGTVATQTSNAPTPSAGQFKNMQDLANRPWSSIQT